MDFDRLLAHLSQLPPSERPELLLQLGVPPQQIPAQLHRMEQMAVQQGHRLRGGPSMLDGGGEEDEDGEGGGEEAASGPLSNAQVRACGRRRAHSRSTPFPSGARALTPRARTPQPPRPRAAVGGHTAARANVGRPGPVLGRLPAGAAAAKGAARPELGRGCGAGAEVAVLRLSGPPVLLLL